jgi:hypothetical protein
MGRLNEKKKREKRKAIVKCGLGYCPGQAARNLAQNGKGG